MGATEKRFLNPMPLERSERRTVGLRKKQLGLDNLICTYFCRRRLQPPTST